MLSCVYSFHLVKQFLDILDVTCMLHGLTTACSFLPFPDLPATYTYDHLLLESAHLSEY